MKIDFLGIPVDAITMTETVRIVDEAVANGKRINHVVINACKVVSMQEDRELLYSVVNCDIINADGQSIVWAARFLGNKIPERVAGADLMQELVGLAHRKKYKCFFFGAKEEIVRKVAEIYSEKYGNEIIAGFRNGYYNKEEESFIAKQIADSGAQMLFVAISSPKKEIFLHEYRDILNNVSFTMGVGGTFDCIAGFRKRAPRWMQNIGMEWFYRFLQEPGRMWRRYLIGNFRFICLIIRAKFKKIKLSNGNPAKSNKRQMGRGIF